LKAISVRQPWAWLILHAGKDVENRTWQTSFRGRVLIHAPKGMSRLQYEAARSFVARLLAEAGEPDLPREWFPRPIESLCRGGIVGSVEIVDCVRSSASPWFEGPFGFVLRNPQPLPFRSCVGKLGLFEVEDH